MSRIQDGSKPVGQVMGLVRYATKHGGVTKGEIKAVLLLNTEDVDRCLRLLAEKGKVRPGGSGRWVAPPPT